MSTDSLLHATLALYHDGSSAGAGRIPVGSSRLPPVERVFANTTALLANLTNPLNVTLLASHFLAAPAVWEAAATPEAAARVCMRVISVFHTAAVHVRRHELEDAAAHRHGLLERLRQYAAAPAEPRRLTSEAWAVAVAAGADARSPRWRHLLVLVGVLLGLESGGRQALSRGRRAALEQGVVAAAGLALDATPDLYEPTALDTYAVVLGLVHAFPLLSVHARAGLPSDAVLAASLAQLAGPHGFQGGAILQAIEAGLPPPTAGSVHVHWPATAPSFRQLQQLESPQQPLVAGAGPLAILASWAAGQATPGAVLAAVAALEGFAGNMARHWASCGRLAAAAAAETTGAGMLSAETAQTTWPALWQHLRRALYAVVVVQQALVGRSLHDRALGGSVVAAPQLAAGVLRGLSYLAFVSSRRGAAAFQAYAFSYLAAADLLARDAGASTAFLEQLLATTSAWQPQSPADSRRLTADLFYLNIAEQLAAVIPPAAADRLLVQPALPYISPASDAVVFSQQAHEVFEAAHSALLAALACPHNAPMAAALSPFYAEALFASFPTRISARQFRVAFRTLIQILSPPFPVYATHPDLAETLLEMVLLRATAGGASTLPLPVEADADTDAVIPTAGATPISEQSALVLTLIDALPWLALPVLPDWMTLAATALWSIGDPVLRQAVQRRFWEVLGSGEMDVERAALCVAWWGNGGGSVLVLGGPDGIVPVTAAAAAAVEPLMSGALTDGRLGTKL